MFIERRTDQRLACHISANVRIIIPEETFTALQHDSIILDISSRGMKLRTWEIVKATYQKLLSSSRMVRISFLPPGGEKPYTLFGKIHWFDFNNMGKTPITTYGIRFEETTKEDNKVIQQCLQAISPKAPEDG